MPVLCRSILEQTINSNDQSLDNVQLIRLNLLNITFIDECTFKNLTNLQLLDISENHLTHFDVDLFSDLTSLTHLNLDSNKLTYLNETLFGNLSNLQYLNLSQNQLTYLPVGLLKGLYNLQYLSMSHNELTFIYASLFLNLYSLVYLDLSSNSLYTLVNDIAAPIGSLNIPITNLSEIHLENNLFDVQSQQIFTYVFGHIQNDKLFTVYLEGNSIYSEIANIQSLCGMNSNCLIVPDSETTTIFSTTSKHIFYIINVS